jgi:filamin
VTDSSLVLVSGDGLKMASVAQPAQFAIDPRGTDISGCVVSVVSPLGKNVPVTIKHLPSGLLQAVFAPDEVGPHQVSLTLQGEHLGASPYTCNVYDVNNVKVSREVTTSFKIIFNKL